MYVQIAGTIGTFAGLGIGSSGVRQIAEANGSGDQARMAATVATLRRACWFTGLLGWLLSAALAWPLSLWMLGDSSHAWAIALLGATVLFSAISSGQNALLQGVRRIGDLARINVLTTVLNTLVAVGLYAWLRERGIVPVLLAISATQVAVSWYFARRIKPAPIRLSTRETVAHAKELVSLGLAFMWSGLLGSLVALAIRSMIIREVGLDANGLYQAAWAISGMFAGFVLGAMGADFYPRLTAVAKDHEAVARLVNEQTEIGILLALPGLAGTLAFAPWLMRLLYSAKFVPAAALLPWFTLGIFGQVVSWPMAIILVAKGAKGWYATTETSGGMLRLGLSFWLLHTVGLVGTAIAIPVLYAFYTALVFCIARRLAAFHWSKEVLKLLFLSALLISLTLSAARYLPDRLALIVGAILTAASLLFSVRSLATRLGRDHRLVRAACRFPGGRLAVGL